MKIIKIISLSTLIALVGTQCWGAAETTGNCQATEIRILTPDKINNIVEQLLDLYDSQMRKTKINQINRAIEYRQRAELPPLSKNEKQTERICAGVFLTDEQRKSIIMEFIKTVQGISRDQKLDIARLINQRIREKYPWESYPIRIVTNQN